MEHYLARQSASCELEPGGSNSLPPPPTVGQCSNFTLFLGRNELLLGRSKRQSEETSGMELRNARALENEIIQIGNKTRQWLTTFLPLHKDLRMHAAATPKKISLGGFTGRASCYSHICGSGGAARARNTSNAATTSTRRAVGACSCLAAPHKGLAPEIPCGGLGCDKRICDNCAARWGGNGGWERWCLRGKWWKTCTSDQCHVKLPRLILSLSVLLHTSRLGIHFLPVV